jgi:hypothetical protein
MRAELARQSLPSNARQQTPGRPLPEEQNYRWLGSELAVPDPSRNCSIGEDRPAKHRPSKSSPDIFARGNPNNSMR